MRDHSVYTYSFALAPGILTTIVDSWRFVANSATGNPEITAWLLTD
jgi:hypothetical protein